MKIEELADKYTTKFILDCTKYSMDGKIHRALTRAFMEFGQQLIADKATWESLGGIEHEPDQTYGACE